MLENKNLELYEKVRSVPENAQKTIQGGRLKGFTDINPSWRIKELTEQFGPCGFGWKYEITRQWTEITAPDTIAAFVNINLYVKYDGEWSEAIPGTGGSSLLSNEKNGLYTNDECYKMGLTDALSVACKALGMGADIYWGADNTKYNDSKPNNIQTDDTEYKCEQCGLYFKDFEWNGNKYTAKTAHEWSTKKNGRALCKKCADTAAKTGESA